MIDDNPELRLAFESLANKDNSFGLKRSRRGVYVNPAIARDWKWFQLGSQFKPEPQTLDKFRGIGGLSPLEQFIAYVEQEKELNPPPEGKKHIAEWALEYIYSLAPLSLLQKEIHK